MIRCRVDPKKRRTRNPVPSETLAQVEEGRDLSPKFGDDGLMPRITTDAGTVGVLMLGRMNPKAVRLTIQSGEAHYFSRARQVLWRKGATSGLVQKVVEAPIDDDQDAIRLRVEVAGTGASCHVGYRPASIVPCRSGAMPGFFHRIRTGAPELVLIEEATPVIPTGIDAMILSSQGETSLFTRFGTSHTRTDIVGISDHHLLNHLAEIGLTSVAISRSDPVAHHLLN